MITVLQKGILFLILMTGGVSLLTSQNLVPNYSFETLSSCPTSYGGPGPTLAPPWIAPTLGTPDIFNTCVVGAPVDVPSNSFGDQAPVTGEGYGGGYCKLSGFEYSEYLQAQLTEPLTAGT